VRVVTNDPGTGRFTLRPKIVPDDRGLIVIWNEDEQPTLTVYRSVLERLAPNSVQRVERAIGRPFRTKAVLKVVDISSQVLEALTAAYQESSGLESHHVDSGGFED
jgi:hypothetical protein